MPKMTKKSSPAKKRPFHQTGWGIALISYISLGVALPFLLWARGPKTKERRKKIVMWTTIVLVVLPLPVLGAFVPSDTDNVETGTEGGSIPGRPMSMPDIIGKSVYDISESLAQLEKDLDLDIRYSDLVGDRGMWNQANWTVVIQAPAAGQRLSRGQLVCVGVRKKDEVESQHQYRLASDCPSALGPDTWPPTGFELVMNKTFAWNTQYRTNDRGHVSCKLERNDQVFISNTGTGEGRQEAGTLGRCSYWEFLTKERCRNIQVRFQWLTSIDTVIGMSTTWVNGPIAERERFRVAAFLPNQAWNKALGSSRIYEINCN